MRSIPLAASIVLAACSRPGAAPGPSAPSSPATGPSAGAHTPETVCHDLAAVASRCPQIGFGRVDVPRCVRSLGEASTSDWGRKALQASGRCLTEQTGCDQIFECLSAATGSSKELRACDEDKPGLRVGIPRAEWDRRNGAGVTTFRGARSTKALPIEMCGVPDANLWLTTLRCDDGSQPLQDRADAEHVRSGNVGPGGRCGSIVDLYVVPCPEARYEIFIDAYVCALPDP